jgi:hypothetical protein
MIYAVLALGAVGGAFARRVLGGLLSQWEGRSVSYWLDMVPGLACLMPAIDAVHLTLHPDPLRTLTLVGAWVAVMACNRVFGYALPGSPANSGGLGMGRRQDDPLAAPTMVAWGRDAALVGYHGVATVALACGLLATQGLPFLPLLVAGLVAPIAYEVGYRLRLDVPVLGLLWQPERGLCDCVPACELLWGACLGTGLILCGV